MNSKSTREPLSQRLRNHKYRRGFADANVGVQIAAQLYALRARKGLSQEKLATLINMGQATISQMEKPNYQRYNTKTLKRFAEFYDVALDVRFVTFEEFVKRIINQKPEDMAPPPFDEEMAPAEPPNPVEIHPAPPSLGLDEGKPADLAHSFDLAGRKRLPLDTDNGYTNGRVKTMTELLVANQ